MQSDSQLDHMTDLATSADVDDTVAISLIQQEQIFALQQKILTSVARNAPYLEVVNELCRLAEQLLPNAVASVMLVDASDKTMSVLAAPSVPPEGHQALNGLHPGPEAGSCGTAVFTNQPVFVRDTFSDPRWRDMQDIAYNFNLCACWSMPIRNNNGESIGSFALSSFEHRLPSAFHKRLLEACSQIVNVVLERHELEQEVEKSQHRLQLLGLAIESSSEGIVITDADNKIIEVNGYFEQATGYSIDEARGKNPSFLSSGQQDKAFYQTLWQTLLDSGSWSGKIVNRRKDGSYLSQWSTINLIKDAGGQIKNYVAVFADLTELQKEKDRYIHALEIDQLTGLPNKSRLQTSLNNGCCHHCSLLVLNVNNFSLINSAYGLDFADRLLIEITKQLKSLLSQAQLYRLNADEFAAHYTSEMDLEDCVKRVRQHFFINQIELDGLSFHISFTYGGAVGCKDLMRQSLLAIKKAKQEGKGRFHLYSTEHDEIEQSQRLDYIQWNTLLHRALNEDGLVPYFQGIRDNETGKISHYETLIRMSLDGTVYGPYQFLNAAKLSGLLPTITRLVIDRSFAFMAQHQCDFAINITEDDLSQHFLIEYLDRKSEQYGITPSRVILEILEGISASGKKNHIRQLSELKARGYRLAIDDFGTEYSNFERILELDVDCIKIDAKYIKNIDTDKTSYEITRAIVFFAQNAGITVVAEFVHSESVQAVIESLGIQYSQGYLFSEPKPYLC